MSINTYIVFLSYYSVEGTKDRKDRHYVFDINRDFGYFY